MYRVLAEAGEVRERRNVRAAQVHPMPSHTTTAPNQVWSWDITKLATTEKGKFLQLYVIIDLFSRQVVGWSMQSHMKAELVTDALRMAWFRRRPDAGVIVHSDRVAASIAAGSSRTR